MFKNRYCIAIIISIPFLTACDSHTLTNNSEAICIDRVNTINVEYLPTYQVKRKFSGTIQSAQNAKLGFEFGGKVDAIYVSEGESVTEGQPLIKLDTRLLHNETKQLQAQLEQVKAQLELVSSNLRRQKKLMHNGFSSKAEIDALISDHKRLSANIQQINESLISNKLRIEKSTLLAPYNGKIGERFVSIGDITNAGSPVLSLLSEENKEARIGVPLEYIDHIKKNSTRDILIANRVHKANLVSTGTFLNKYTRTVELRYHIPDQESLVDGQLVYLDIYIDIFQDGFWVPLSALTEGIKGSWSVYAIINNDNKNVISRRAVQIHYTDGKNAFISGEFKNGEKIVSSGVHSIVPGQQVKIVEE
ncbi:efflux RND transporter periplasmic adaptor subunit [Vibrio cholerae]|uniref:efflux RND transporter periplasmic adaptor subunit n=1 Tax=Vibrio cholerae TaxID=666 RepID=UPI002083F2BC|nr:efflux RND transporter periplasmic adaptor subunit [Vibrio cholerae]EKG0018360.1 efflux RND transporter periplasmic adaptor subunit [Vibrio cholerae]ELA3029796.1 efflux RND transporter periplasmic adaptor subunit [Vibrio cholerae]ELN7714994.1 efflux RND transporter periplasmic adaptor subunit [Vibrio cholerae]GHZ98915.1 efflux transporter periplasmic adaptor subunit [Vibrio cholerae]